MKRAIKILTLILIVVFVFAVFASCDLLVGKDVAKYRKQVAMRVGSQDVTVGKLLDTFNSYYNNYYYYISAGILDANGLLEMVMSSLTQQYMQIDDYVTRHKNDADVVASNLKGKARNAEFLTAEEWEYCVKYILHVSFTSFDSSVEAQLAAKFDLKDAETEDTSRDFAENDDIAEEIQDYAEYYFRNQNFNSEEVDEYFDKYYSNALNFEEVDIESYVYANHKDEVAEARLKEYNDRLEDDSEEITLEDYAEIQQKVLTQYRDTVKSNYGITLEEFLANQLNDMVSSSILAKWSYEAYVGFDQSEEFTDLMEERFALERAKQIADFNNSKDAFDSFITSLSSSSYIYNVPEEFKGQYVFVKNILVPFTTAQTNRLNALQNRLGDTERPEYIAARNAEAVKILAEYFDSDKYDEDIESKYFSNENWFKENEDEDAERKYEKLSGLFTNTSGELAIADDGVLGQFFKANGVVEPMEGKTGSETIIELMKRFNTDVGQHTAQYDYVVYVGKDWEDYEHSWVKEFYTAVNKMGNRAEDSEFSSDNVGKYTMCVSTYGVHIIYVEGFVEDSDQVFGTQLDLSQSTDSASPYYRWFVSTFTSEVQTRVKAKLEELQPSYSDKITTTREFDKFLKENSFTFDLDAFLEGLKED